MYTLLMRVSRLALATALLLYAATSQAQLIGNGGFDSSNQSCTNTSSPFFAGCVPSWRASHGSPQIKGSGDVFAYMWSESGKGEGIFTQLTGLTANTRYELAFSIRGFNNPLLAVKIATNMVSSGTEKPDGGNIPTYNAVWSQRYYPNPTWTQYIVQITVPSNGDYQLWIYPETSAADHTHYDVYVNDVSFDPVDCLTRNIYYQNTNSIPILTKTKGTIAAGQQVTTLQGIGPASVRNGQSVILVASQQIKLESGFSAEQGADFQALIGATSCAVSRLNYAWWTATPVSTTSSTDSSSVAPTQQAFRQSQNSTTIYPNPAADQLTITVAVEGSDSNQQQAIIANSYGVDVKRINLRGGPATISIKELPAGIYYMRTQSKNRVNTIRFEIKR